MIFGDVFTSKDKIIVYLGSKYESFRKLWKANDLQDNLYGFASTYNLIDYTSLFLILPRKKGQSIEKLIDSCLSNPKYVKTFISTTKDVEDAVLPIVIDRINDKYYSVLYNLEKRLKYWDNKADAIKIFYMKYKMLNIEEEIPPIYTESDTKEQKKFLNDYFKREIPKKYLDLKCGDVIKHEDYYALYTGTTRDFSLEFRELPVEELNHYSYNYSHRPHFVVIWKDYNFKKVNHLDFDGLNLSYRLPVGGLR